MTIKFRQPSQIKVQTDLLETTVTIETVLQNDNSFIVYANSYFIRLGQRSGKIHNHTFCSRTGQYLSAGWCDRNGYILIRECPFTEKQMNKIKTEMLSVIREYLKSPYFAKHKKIAINNKLHSFIDARDKLEMEYEEKLDEIYRQEQAFKDYFDLKTL